MNDNIKHVKFGCQEGIDLDPFWQYDRGQVLVFEDVPDGAEVQIEHDGSTLNKIVQGGQITVPDILMDVPGTIKAYVVYVEPDSTTTVKSMNLRIKARVEPSDVVPPEDEPTFREQIEEIMDDAKAAALASKSNAEQAAGSAEEAEQSAQNAEQAASGAAMAAHASARSASEAQAIAQSVRDDADAGKFKGDPGERGADGAKGEKGDKGDRGPAGSDASVTAANIKNALGYTPADEAGLDSVNQDIASLQTEVDGKADASDLINKVDKVEGKSLMSDSEIARLASVRNYDDSAVRAELAKKAIKSDVDAEFNARMRITDVGGGLIFENGVLKLGKPSTPEQIRQLCRNGTVEEALEIGETYELNVNGVKQNFIVMDFIRNGKHSDGLQLTGGLKTGVILQSETILYLLQFDAREAFYYAPNGMSAGTYNFTLKEHTWYSADVGETFQFTLSKAVPSGGQLVFVQNYNATLDGGRIDVFDDGNSASASQSATMSVGSNGTALGELKNSINGNFNSCQRALMGSNNWKDSALRQHLNSAEASNYWVSKTAWDRPPSWRTSQKGLLNIFDPEWVDYIVPVSRHAYRNTVSDGGGLDTTEDKIFLASRKEVYMPAEGADDTTPWEFYRIKSQYSSPSTNADSCRVKYRTDNGQPYYWWLESPNVGIANNVRIVGTTGANDTSNAYNSHGVAPAFVIA